MFLALIVALDAGMGTLLRHFYFTQKGGLNYRTTYAVEQSRDSIIVLGSSRAQAHYVPSILENGLEGSCYNAGRNGQSVLYASAVHQAILARQAPEVIILDLIPTDFYEYHGHYDRLSALLPYYDGNEAVRPIVQLRSPWEQLKLASRIYPFNSLPLQILKYNLVDQGEDNGFVAQHGQVKEPLRAPKERVWIRNGLDEHALKTFTDLVTSCVENDVELYVVLSPWFDGKVFGKEALTVIEAILADTPYRVWDYSADEGFLGKPTLFRDRDHLNMTGAEVFTGRIMERIQADRSGPIL